MNHDALYYILQLSRNINWYFACNICIPKDPAHEFADRYQCPLILHPLEVGLYSHSYPHCPTPRGLHKIIDIIDYVKVYVAYMIYDKIKQYRIELDNLLTVA